MCCVALVLGRLGTKAWVGDRLHRLQSTLAVTAATLAPLAHADQKQQGRFIVDVTGCITHVDSITDRLADRMADFVVDEFAH